MYCCEELTNLEERGHLRVSAMAALRDGRILTEIDTEYFLVFGAERPSYVGMNYCPFCGRALSRGLWNLEKKKQ
jgi:hypothetical protein